MSDGKEQFDILADHFDYYNNLTGDIQMDMVKALLENPNIKEDFDNQKMKSEEEMQHRINKAVFAFVGAMPLASINGINLFMEAIALHSNLTGNPLMHKIIKRINEINENKERLN